jgi:LPPG:FO 2-phospho-L-lactate transferase
VPAQAFVQVGLEQAEPAAGVLDAINNADLVLFAPSNPVVSIDTILNIAGIRDAVTSTKAPVVGLSPIIGGAPVRGMADACLPVIDVEISAEGVGRHYGARTSGGVLDGWLIHSTDQARIDGVTVLARDLLMSSHEVTAEMVADAAKLAGR